MLRPLLCLILIALSAPAARGQFGPDGMVGPGESYHVVFATSFQTGLTTSRLNPPIPFDFGGTDAASWFTTFAAFNAGSIPGWNGQDIVYRAVLSDSKSDAVDTANIQGRVYNTNGDLLAVDSADFFDGQLVNPVGYDENGNAIPVGQDAVWSGTATSGVTNGAGCGCWDLTGDSVTPAGSANSTSWLLGPALQCDNSTARLLGISPAITAPILGDFDDDGDADVADLMLWQRGGGSAMALSDWQAGFGFGEAASATVAVPEPSAALLMLAAAGFVLRRRC